MDSQKRLIEKLSTGHVLKEKKGYPCQYFLQKKMDFGSVDLEKVDKNTVAKLIKKGKIMVIKENHAQKIYALKIPQTANVISING